MDRTTIAALTIVLAVSAAACIQSSPTAPIPAHIPPPPELLAVTVSGGGSGNPGQTTQLDATASFSNGSIETVTQQASWTTGNAAVATVAPGGVVTFVAVGEAAIQATFGGKSGTARVSVVPAPIPRRTLTGTVIDGGRRTGLPDARVEIVNGPDAGKSTTTRGDGSFSIPDVAEGTFTLRFSHPQFDSVQQSVTLTATARIEVTLRPLLDLSSLFGMYGISLSVRQQVCSSPITPAPTGTLEIRGNADGSNLTVTITERGVSRDYRGSMGSDGSFSGNGGGFIPGHDFSGSIQGRVIGNSLTAAESMTYGAPCPGGILEISITGSR